jgi:hypothetical protein
VAPGGLAMIVDPQKTYELFVFQMGETTLGGGRLNTVG